MTDQTLLSADVIVVGSGPGGATVARQLARSGRDEPIIFLHTGGLPALFAHAENLSANSTV